MKYSLALIVLLLVPGGSAEARWYKCKHEVLPGESLASIAKRYNVSVRRLSASNRIRGKWIRPGKKLRIRSRHPCRLRHKFRYTIKRRDTLVKVAKKHGMSLRLLRRLNPRVKRRLIRGKRLWVVVEGRRPNGRILGMHQLHTGAGYVVRDGRNAWGTFLAVTRLVDVFAAHDLKYPKADPLKVDDLSRKGGGRLKMHASHRTGRDVDIRYPLTIKTMAYVRANARTLDVPRTWNLLHSFIKTGDVIYIFVDRRLQRILYNHAVKQGLAKDKLNKYFQYPGRGRGAGGIIRHEPGHATHMHVRFRRSTPDEEPNT